MSEKYKKNLGVTVFLIIVFGLLMLTGCANVSVTPPTPRLDAAQSRAVPGNYVDVWARAIGWFDAHEVEITEIDERLGTIFGRFKLPTEATVLDYGTFHVRKALSPPRLSREAQVRVQMRGAMVSQPSVLISVTGHYQFEMIDNYAAETIKRSGPCVSRGVLERNILDFLTG